jgi:hypothetical protein
LAEQHGDELGPAGETLGGSLGAVFLNQGGEFRPGKVLEQLIEEARDLYDWVALLWQRMARFPPRILLASVNYRRASSSISECKNLFWTTVQPGTIRAQVLTCGAILGRGGRRVVVHLSQSWGGLRSRIPLLDSILACDFPTSPKLTPVLGT